MWLKGAREGAVGDEDNHLWVRDGICSVAGKTDFTVSQGEVRGGFEQRSDML